MMLQTQVKPLFELNGRTEIWHLVLFAVWICGVNSAGYSFLFTWVLAYRRMYTTDGVTELRNTTLGEGKHQDKLLHSGWNLH